MGTKEEIGWRDMLKEEWEADPGGGEVPSPVETKQGGVSEGILAAGGYVPTIGRGGGGCMLERKGNSCER